MLLLLSLACTDAPFSLIGSKALWITSSENDDKQGTALLMITTGDIECGELKAVNESGDGITGDQLLGQGLVISFYYDSYGKDVEHGESFEGFWTTGYSYGYGPLADGQVERGASVYMFKDGFLYSSYAVSLGVSEVNYVDIKKEGSTVSGNYHIGPWDRGFRAEDCGKYAVSDGVDSWGGADSW